MVTAAAWVYLLGQGPHSKSWSPETLNTSNCLNAVTLPLVLSPQRASPPLFSPSPPSFIHGPQLILHSTGQGPAALDVMSSWDGAGGVESALSQLGGGVRVKE